MEKVEEAIARVEVELFGKTYEIEPTFELIAEFERRMGTSLVNSEHWTFPYPKVSAAAMLLWLGIGGPGSGKTLKDVAAALKARHLVQAVGLANMVAAQLTEPDPKKDDAAG